MAEIIISISESGGNGEIKRHQNGVSGGEALAAMAAMAKNQWPAFSEN
jgi:hypothetical protein